MIASTSWPQSALNFFRNRISIVQGIPCLQYVTPYSRSSRRGLKKTGRQVFLGAFEKLLKATVSFVTSVCLEQLGSNLTDGSYVYWTVHHLDCWLKRNQLALLFLYIMLNMFRMLIHPSSGACDLCVVLFLTGIEVFANAKTSIPHRSM